MARTRVSNWAYRATSALMVATSAFILRYFTQFPVILKNIDDLLPESGMVQIQFFSGYLAFLFATIAILMRSGAVIWLIALFGLVKMWAPVVVFRDDGYFASIRFDAVAGCLIILLSFILFWFVAKEEIRRP
ncbi:hypothetical protein [Agrobacterium sp. CG674]